MNTNFDLLLNFNKNISRDLNFKGFLGGNIRKTNNQSIYMQVLMVV